MTSASNPSSHRQKHHFWASPILMAGLLLGGASIALVFFPSSSSAQPNADAHNSGGTLYECPMDKQVTSDGPGRCPLCHMKMGEHPAKDVLAKVKAWEQKTGKKAPPLIHRAKTMNMNMKMPMPMPTSGATPPPSTQKKAPTPAPRANKRNVPKLPLNSSTGSKKTSTAPPASSSQDADYTCPMHQHISEDKDGHCPVCGMNLVPRSELATMDENYDHNHNVYSCPMHPGIVTDEAGRCPICGMDLELKGSAQPKAEAESGKKKPRQILHWVAPMNPTYIRDKPGKSPMGMDLVPVYADDDTPGSTIKVDPVVVQNMGVRLARAQRQPLFRHIRTLGTVDVAEDQVSVVNLRFSGWVEKLYVNETGIKVKKGEWLAEIYSPELVSAQEEYLLALRTRGPLAQLAKSARRRLGFFGMSESDIKSLETKREAHRTIRIRAPQEGYVLHKAVVEGARVRAGQDIFRIGNLQKIWINAEVYEFDAPWIRLNAPATMELSFQQGKTYSGLVSYIYPTLNPKTRTLRVRLEFENPGLALKPGMFATVRIETRRIDGALAIPTESIIHSGEREIVFVALGGGHYDKREVITGLVADRYLTEILDGISEGERIVTSGQFLLDSESQLQEAVQKLLDKRLEAKDPGMNAAAHVHTEHKSKDGKSSYWTCSMHPQIVQDGSGTCPICGMNLVQRKR